VFINWNLLSGFTLNPSIDDEITKIIVSSDGLLLETCQFTNKIRCNITENNPKPKYKIKNKIKNQC